MTENPLIGESLKIFEETNLTHEIELIESQNTFRGMREQWNNLLEESLCKSVFLTWEWQYHWWDYYRQIGLPKSLNIFILKNGQGDLLAILPLYRVQIKNLFGQPMQILKFIGSGHESSEYLDMICHENITEQQKEIILRKISHEKYDGLHLSDLRSDSVLSELYTDYAKRNQYLAIKRYGKTCPYLPLEKSYAEYINSLSKNMRYNVRRRTRNLEKSGQVEFKIVDEPGEAEKALHVLYELHRNRWQNREGESNFDDPVRETFHKQVATKMLKGGFLRFYVLTIDEIPVATLYCFHYDHHLYYYQAGMDSAWDKKSIGLVIMGKAIEASFVENSTEFDFLRGLESYKFKWTDKTRDTHILEIGLSPRARGYFQQQERLRLTKKKLKKVLAPFLK